MIDPSPTIAVDFDGVLAEFTSWDGPEVVGAPIPGALESLELVADAFHGDVVIYTTRPAVPVEAWLDRHGALDLVDEIDDSKRYFDVLLDDRAHRVKPNRPYRLAAVVGRLLTDRVIR